LYGVLSVAVCKYKEAASGNKKSPATAGDGEAGAGFSGH